MCVCIFIYKERKARTGKTGKAELDRQHRIGRTGQSEKGLAEEDCQYRESQERIPRTGLPDRARRTGLIG